MKLFLAIFLLAAAFAAPSERTKTDVLFGDNHPDVPSVYSGAQSVDTGTSSGSFTDNKNFESPKSNVAAVKSTVDANEAKRTGVEVPQQAAPIEESNTALPKDESVIPVKNEGVSSTSTLEQGQSVEFEQGIVKPTEESKVELKSAEVNAEPAQITAVKTDSEIVEPTNKAQVKAKTAKSLDISAQKEPASTAEKAVKSGDGIKVEFGSASLNAPAGRSTFGAAPTPFQSNFGTPYGPGFGSGYRSPLADQSYYSSGFNAGPGYTPGFNSFGQNRYDPAFNRGFDSFGFGAKEPAKSSDTATVEVKSVSSEASADASTSAVKSAVADDSTAKAPASNFEAATAGVTSPFQTKFSSPAVPVFGSGYRSPFAGQSYHPSAFGAVSGYTPGFNTFGQNRYNPAFNRGFDSFGFGAKEPAKSSDTATVEVKSVSSEASADASTSAVKSAVADDSTAKAPASNFEAATAGVTSPFQTKFSSPAVPVFGSGYRSPFAGQSYHPSAFGAVSGYTPGFNTFGQNRYDPAFNRGFDSFGFGAKESTKSSDTAKVEVKSVGSDNLKDTAKTAVETASVKDNAPTEVQSADANKSAEASTSDKDNSLAQVPATDAAKPTVESAPVSNSPIDGVAYSGAAVQSVPVTSVSSAGVLSSGFSKAAVQSAVKDSDAGLTTSTVVAPFQSTVDSSLNSQVAAATPVKSDDAPTTEAKPASSGSVADKEKDSVQAVSSPSVTSNVATSSQSKFGSPGASTFVSGYRPTFPSQSFNQYPYGAAPGYNSGFNTFGYNKYNPTVYPGYSFSSSGAQESVKSADATATEAKPASSGAVADKEKDSVQAVSSPSVTSNVATSSQSKFGSPGASTFVSGYRPTFPSQSFNQYPYGAAPGYNSGFNTFGYNKYNPTVYPGYSFSSSGAQESVKSADATATEAKPASSGAVADKEKDSVQAVSSPSVTSNVATSSQSKFGSPGASTFVSGYRPTFPSQSFNQYPYGAAPGYNSGFNTFGYNKYNPTVYPGYSFSSSGAQESVKSADATATEAKPASSGAVADKEKDSVQAVSSPSVTSNVATSSQSKFGSPGASTFVSGYRPTFPSQSFNQYPYGAAPGYNSGFNTFGYNKYNPTVYPGYSFSSSGAQESVKSADAPATEAKPASSGAVADKEKDSVQAVSSPSVTSNVATSSQSKFGSPGASTFVSVYRPTFPSQSFNQYPYGAAPGYNSGFNTFGYNKYNPTVYPGFSFTPSGAQKTVKSADTPATEAKPANSGAAADNEKASVPAVSSSSVTSNVATSSQSKFGSPGASTFVSGYRPTFPSQSFNQYPYGAAPGYNSAFNTFGYNKYNPTVYPGYSITPFGTKESAKFADKVSSEVKPTGNESPAESEKATDGSNNAKDIYHTAAFGAVSPYTPGYNAYNNAIGTNYGPSVHSAYPGFGSYDGSYRHNNFYGRPENYQGYQGYFGADNPAYPFARITDSHLPAGVKQQYYIDHAKAVPYQQPFQYRTGAPTAIAASFTETKPTSSTFQFNREESNTSSAVQQVSQSQEQNLKSSQSL
ncbi:hornerin isoform X2 [Neodiprion lecontei]|uniref:Hornerin isoform X2 n=1 Tax=Neodiprion lecontei TaxID=441921 RepID=A0ABM3GI11_NEOLC|nr:hornerin isoform X2 [Neodiprion lecontei]